MERGPVVFVMPKGSRPSTALARAVEVARRLGADLHVVLVEWDDGTHRDLHATDEGWLDGVLPQHLARRYHETVGYVVHEAIAYAGHGARMIVLPADVGRSGSCVAAIASATHVRVLVARERTAGHAIVAATDLRDARLPIIARAAEMIDDVETTMVGIHNLPPATDSAVVQHQRGKLAMALEPVTRVPEVVVDTAPDPVEAILKAARDRDADLIVAGVRPRPWMDRMLEPSLASRIVANARGSVLLVPLEA